jgi:hypothetical protein
MKFLRFLVFGLLLTGLTVLPVFSMETVTSLVDTFTDEDRRDNQPIDKAPGKDNETPLKTEMFWWGGYSGGDGDPSGGHEAIWLREVWPTKQASIGFNIDANAQGSRIYTRFDADSPLETEKKNSSDYQLDGSDGVFTALVTLSAGQEIAILIRDDNRWYRSESLSVPKVAYWESSVPDEFTVKQKLSELSWFPVIWDDASRDMDEVDAWGETGPLSAEKKAAKPNLKAVLGMGLELVAPPDEEGTHFTMDRIGIITK